ncbi:SGNH/GDSL hydrolase family protein [Niabella beijingensis]|uniref:SGNH/GDSL hydrolase family protein n=1 Tax=Niabella beijingensis TaxID=2872700 RepID=UPI001CC18D62|nr:SGNH/GDSL hydrolase family protein [Niabella beijingensis]MBZ4190909.1 hypothetical protein [Niabella beijingensis]
MNNKIQVKKEAGAVVVPFNDPRIRYEGRIDESDPQAATLCWSGTSMEMTFTGTGISAVLKDYSGQNYFNIIVDGDTAAIKKIRIDSVKKNYILAKDLAPGKHHILLFKRTQINREYNRGYTKFYAVQLAPGGMLLKNPPRSKRKMEFYGNSVTCGHAVEDSSGSDSGAGIYENNYRSYAAVTARHFNARYRCIAESGIGLLSGFRKERMPEIYNRINPFEPAVRWDFSLYQPDVVVVNLLQNDEAVIGNPESEAFRRWFGNNPPSADAIIRAYAGFIRSLRRHYPAAHIVCVLGNMGITRPGSPWPGYVQEAVATLADKKIYTHFFPYKGTPGHPLIKEHEAMAQSLIRFISKTTGW